MSHRMCEACGWHGSESDLLKAPNPFAPGEQIFGCPSCKSIDCFSVVCDEPGCWRSVTCGTPTPAGYRSTCRRHKPEEKEKADCQRAVQNMGDEFIEGMMDDIVITFVMKK